MAQTNTNDYDIAVVGGGIIGWSVAYELKQLNPELCVAVISPNQDTFLSGTETLHDPRMSKIGVGLGLNTLALDPNSDPETIKSVLEITRAGAKRLYAQAREFDPALVEKTGSIVFGDATPDGSNSLDRLVEVCNAIGLKQGNGFVQEGQADYSRLTNSEIGNVLPGVSRTEVAGGLCIPENFLFKPGEYTSLLRKSAGKLGVVCREGTVMTTYHDYGPGVRIELVRKRSGGLTTDEAINVGQLVLATNGFYKDDFLKSAGLQSLATFIASYAIGVQGTQNAHPNFATVPSLDHPENFVYGGMNNGCLWIGGADCEADSRNNYYVNDARQLAQLADLRKKLFPQFSCKPAGTHFGIYAITSDGMPIVGENPSNRNVYYVVGCNGINSPSIYGAHILPAIMGHRQFTKNEEQLSAVISPQRFK